MTAFFDPDDAPEDVRQDAAMERRRRQWTCQSCGGGIGLHNQFCTDGDPEWATRKRSDDDEA